MQLVIKFVQIIALIGVSGLFAQTNVYHVKKIQSDIVITGYGFDDEWKNTNVLTEFFYPWENDEPTKTEFKALWSDTHFYFLFVVEDYDVIIPEKGKGEMDVIKSDRAEIFFKSVDNSKPYYSLEMDALGRCLDSEGIFYNNVDFNWNWPKEHFVLKASQKREGYVVEGSITLESLRQLGLYLDDGILLAGLYRGEYFRKSDNEIGVKWISWVKPKSKSFHIPSSFGTLKLIN